MLRALTMLLSLLTALPALALEVVATTPSMGMLAREVGGPGVTVTVLVPPDRDPHTLQARPSMMKALRGADLLVAVGAELEVGWLPPALSGAANPALLPGRPGHFEAAAQITLLDAGQPADRALGDVHPQGNPHFQMDPLRMVTVARALARRLGELDPAARADYRQRAEDFAGRVAARLPGWQALADAAPGALLYHKDADYLLQRLNIPLLGHIEPIPGVPPTAGHLRELIQRLQGQRGVVIHTVYQPAQAPRSLAETLGWPLERLPLEPSLTATAEDYLALIDRWVQALTGELA